MEQFTYDEAVAFFDSEAWKALDFRQRALFQMEQDRLCMPFAVFHEAVEKTLGRPVWAHEFGLNRQGLMAELEGTAGAPTFEEILALIPANKTIVVAP